MLDDVLERHAPEAYSGPRRGSPPAEITLRECMGRSSSRSAATTTRSLPRPRRGRLRPGFASSSGRPGRRTPRGDRLRRVPLDHRPSARGGRRPPGGVRTRGQVQPQGTTARVPRLGRLRRLRRGVQASMVASLRNGDPVVYIGDGWSDRCAALVADRRFARRFWLATSTAGVDYTPFDDFHTVREALLGPGAEWRPAPARAASRPRPGRPRSARAPPPSPSGSGP